MLCLARAGKLTLDDMDTIMGFPSEEEKEAAHEVFSEMIENHFFLQFKMYEADIIQDLIDDYNAGKMRRTS